MHFRRILMFIALFAVILVAYFALRYIFAPGVKVPSEFYEARSRGAVIAQDIVNESNGVAGDIGQINDLDKAGKYAEALKQIEKVRGETKDIRSRAVDLGNELKIMTTQVENINSETAQQAAVDSITNRLALESRLITYTDEVNKLLSVLEMHFRGQKVDSLEVKKLVNDINGDVNAVNAFNSQAGQAMDRFDAIVK